MSTTFQDVLLKVKEGADIVQIVGQYVSLKRAGSRYVGMCPFHNDRHPSMNVNPSMGIYKCFACGAGGDAIKFVQEYEKLGFVEALKLVASKAGIAIPENLGAGDKGGGEQTAAVIQANQIALQVYTETFDKTPLWQKYVEERGLSKETVKHFQIGCAPENIDRIVKLAEAKKVPGKAFVEAGILGVAAGGRTYDRFGGRLVFPIFNLSGRVIAFGGRIAPGREGAKYINTPESPLYHKGRVLYGFNSARSTIDQSGEAVVVEGYMDLVTLWQFGVKNAVAVCGTALTKEHAQMLTRFARKVYLFFDGDAAGRAAVHKSLQPLLDLGVEVRIPRLDPKEDPDSYVRSHSLEELRALFDAADNLPNFLVYSTGKEAHELTAEEKNSVLNEASGLLANHAKEVREGHLDELRSKLRLKDIPKPIPPRRYRELVLPDDRLGLFILESKIVVKNEDKPEWQLLQLLLYHPQETAVAAADLNLDWFFDDRVREIVDYIQALLIEGGSLNIRVLRDRVPEALQAALDSIVELEMEADSGRLARKLGDYRDAIELRYLKREKAGARTLAEAVEIQKRIDVITRG